MKKKIMLLALALVLLVTPVFAAGGVTKDNSFGLGINLGTNTGAALRFGMGDFDILANVGVSLLNDFVLAGDVAASYNVYTIDGGRALEFPITVGVGATTAIDFNNGGVSLAVIVPVGIEYNFAQLNSDVPITVYLRLAPGLSILSANKVHLGLGWAAYLGAIWNF